MSLLSIGRRVSPAMQTCVRRIKCVSLPWQSSTFCHYSKLANVSRVSSTTQHLRLSSFASFRMRNVCNERHAKSCTFYWSTSGVRWSSSDTSAAVQLNSATPADVESVVSALGVGYIPEPPVAPVPIDALDQFTALGEPTLSSLGLCSWWPSGWVQSGLEALHVSLDVPWWGAIAIGTLIVRFFMFPIAVLAQRNAANMHNHHPTLKKLQDKFTAVRNAGNMMETARIGTELMEFIKKNNIDPKKQMYPPIAQVPIFLSVFIGIRQMANLPVLSMQTGGMAWFTDLTVADPYYALPIITMATLFVTMELGAEGVRAATMSQTGKYVMRALPVVILPFIMNFPSALLCYWMTTNLISLSQVALLRIPSIRTYFKIPQLVKHEIVVKEKQGIVQTVKDTYRNAKMAAKSMEEIRKDEALKFKQAGTGAIQKTYSYDPTKVKTHVAAKAK